MYTGIYLYMYSYDSILHSRIVQVHVFVLLYICNYVYIYIYYKYGYNSILQNRIVKVYVFVFLSPHKNENVLFLPGTCQTIPRLVI